jgi:DNA-binding winged helix-turn-helix (wHTH) protein
LIYQTHHIQIDEQALTAKNTDGVKLNIRPKTCQLLVLLVKNSGKAINKQTLLETIWGGSIVSDQVVFQSINEIRRLFPNEEVIKTIPKQGYVWLPDAAIIEKDNEHTKPVNTYFKSVFITFLTLGIALTSLYVFIQQYDDANKMELSQQNVSGSIVILPIQNHIKGNDHSWVRLGMMDQVIQRLPNSQSYAVLQTDYVLEVLNRASSPLNDLLPGHIQQIFKVSGAELIVSSKLIGVPYDYQLTYVFHYRNRLKKGVLFNKKLQPLIDEFSLLVASQLSDVSLPVEITYQADFNNEMLGAVIEKHLESNYQSAKPMLESIVLNNPENLTAQRLLVGNLFRLKLFEQAAERIDIALPIARKLKDKDELTRLLYSKALYHYVVYKDKQASDIAEQALASAKDNNDWLFMAHIKNIQANVAVNNNNFQLAEKLYLEEKQHHQVLHCPVGESLSWANLARLALRTKQVEKFDFAINKAIDIAQTRDLTSQLNYFMTIKEQGFNE